MSWHSPLPYGRNLAGNLIWQIKEAPPNLIPSVFCHNVILVGGDAIWFSQVARAVILEERCLSGLLGRGRQVCGC